MYPVVNITPDHPKQWNEFKRWHAKACPSDPLSAEERFIKEGHKLPRKDKGDDDSGTKEKE